MVRLCQRCELAARYKYWHEVPVTKHKFCKIMLGDFEHQLIFPHKFVECFKGKLARECTLRGPGGNEWKVGIERTQEGDVVMSTGWESFVRDHGVHITDFLTFRYLGGSAFKVSIFNATGCEREGTYFARPMNGNLYTGCPTTLHDSENGGFDCLFESEEESANSPGEGRLAGQYSEASDEEPNVRSTRGRESGKCKIPKEKGENGENICIPESKAKKKRVPSFEDLNMSGEEGEESSCGGDLLWAHSLWQNKRRGESSKARQSRRYHISNRRSVSEAERQIAYDNAMSHMKSRKPSGVPVFAVTMSQTNVCVGFNLTIPKEWALKHMLKDTHEVELKVPGAIDSWIVGCRWTPSQCQIRANWLRFVLENNLEEHDVCVLELVQKGEPDGTRSPVFMVNIFRVVAETVPLTSIRL